MAIDYNSMTVAELKAYAKNNRIPLSQYDKTKADIIDTISKFELNKFQGEFKNLTVAELKEYAENNRIQLPSGGKKADIIAAIIAAEYGDVANADVQAGNLVATWLQTTPGRTILKNSDSAYKANFKLGVYTICPKCGEEVYASCYTVYDDETADKYPQIADQLKKCPKCKGKLGLVKGRYSQEYIEKSAESKYMPAFKALRKNIDEIDRDSLREKANQFIEKTQKIEDKSNDAIRQLSFEELKKYILYLIHMESEIYFLNERLVELQMKELANNQSYTRAQIIVESEVEKDFNQISKNSANEIRSIKQVIAEPEKKIDKDTLVVKLDQDKPVEPIKPTTTKPIEPHEPEYKKPGLFNKKKINAENEELKREYEREKGKYEAALSVYENEQEVYLSRLAEFKDEEKKYMNAYKKAYTTVLEKEKKRIVNENEVLLRQKEEENKQLNKKKKDKIDEYLDMSPQKSISSMLSFEEKGVKQELKKVISARDELYSYGIIYGKYRNNIALTTLYEYLDSGRCNSLEGPEGAYNLFESETRTNEIIVQLKTIVDSLEAIKSNQFMLYKEMKEVNKNLNSINSSLGKAINEIRSLRWTVNDTNKYLADIGNTTKGILATSAITAYNTALTAHYSAITAHYSKVNAELTNALGFMIAMK